MAKSSPTRMTLLEELGVEVETKKQAARSPREERIIAGFRGDSALRRRARARTAAWRGSRHLRAALCRAPGSHARWRNAEAGGADRSSGLAAGHVSRAEPPEEDEFDDDALARRAWHRGWKQRQHHRAAHVRVGARRRRCRGDRQSPALRGFRDLQAAVRAGAAGPGYAGVRQTRALRAEGRDRAGRFFIVGGQKAYVAEMGERRSCRIGRPMPVCASSSTTAPRATC
jgi:hypothetical protein